MSGAKDPDQLREEIEETRAELGDTVAAMAHKTDVKAQVKERIEHAKASVEERIERTKVSVAREKGELIGEARHASPESALSAASQASDQARRHPLLLAAAGSFAIGFIAGRRT
jgi:hypothetical protein